MAALRHAHADRLTLFRTLAVLGSPSAAAAAAGGGGGAAGGASSRRMVEAAVRTGVLAPHALTWRDTASAIRDCVAALGRGAAEAEAGAGVHTHGDRLLATALSVREGGKRGAGGLARLPASTRSTHAVANRWAVTAGRGGGARAAIGRVAIHPGSCDAAAVQRRPVC
jgi:hypothetical protein